jgi:energy-coupling factor transporter transmembrane protein EcfT
MSEKDAEKKAAQERAQASLRAAGLLLGLAGLMAAMATFREGRLIGQGLMLSGALVWTAGRGWRKNWRWFPAAPLLAALAALAFTAHGCFRSLGAR